MAEALIELAGVAFGYGGRPVIAGVDLTVEPGKLLGIAGPNGAGKTTLFRGVLGLIPPLEGRVERRTKALGYVPQRESLDPLYPMTVLELVHTGAYGRLRGWRRLAPEDRDLALRSLEQVGLLERAGTPFASLSDGQRQRALVARALLEQPEVLVLDEPTSGVDSRAAQAIVQLLEELATEQRLAILLVSHEIALLERAAGELFWVEGGRVRLASAEELLAAQRVGRLFQSGGAP